MLISLYILLIFAVITDIRSHRIPNVLSLGGIAVALVLHVIFSGWFASIEVGLSGMIVGFLLFLPFYLKKAMAAGDVKLMAAVGAFVGPFTMIYVAACTMISGLVLALMYVAYKGGGKKMLSRYSVMAKTFLTTRQKIYIPPERDDGGMVQLPYALAICTGAFIGIGWAKGTLL